MDGRWISREYLGEEEDINLYRYLKNSPLQNIDFLGLQRRTAEAIGSIIDLIGDVVGGITLATGDGRKEVQEECRDYCINYASKNLPYPSFGKSCCKCTYSIREASTGNVHGIVYSLYEVIITLCHTCENMEENKGAYSQTILYSSGGQMGVVIDPVTKSPKGIQAEAFTV